MNDKSIDNEDSITAATRDILAQRNPRGTKVKKKCKCGRVIKTIIPDGYTGNLFQCDCGNFVLFNIFEDK